MSIRSRCSVTFLVWISLLLACSSSSTSGGQGTPDASTDDSGTASDAGADTGPACTKIKVEIPRSSCCENCASPSDCCAVPGVTVECRTIKGSFYKPNTVCCLPNGSSCSSESNLSYGPQGTSDKFTSTQCCSRMCGSDGKCGCMPPGLGTACTTDSDCCPAASGEPATCADFGSSPSDQKWCCLPSGANAHPSGACCSGSYTGAGTSRVCN